MAFPHLHLGGGAYDIGHGLGEFGREAVHRHLRPLPLWQRLADLAGSDAARSMRAAVERRFPRYWQELEGLADGLELPLEEVFLWNCRGDFVQQQSIDGCTTMLGPTARGTLIAHNEDGFPQLRGHCALVSVSPEQGLGFTSFVYPGSIPGHTFAVNEKGLVVTVNNIRPRAIPAGLPRQVLGRASLDAASIDEAVDILASEGRAGAFHHALGQLGSQRLVSFEGTSEGASVVEVQHPCGHSNHLVHPALGGVAQRITGSSGKRQACVDARIAGLGERLDRAEALAILRDTSGGDLPVYRCAADDPDDENTLATALFLIGADAVDWAVYTEADIHTPTLSGRVVS
ncbi:acyl-CoA--6-aminopenicillanic acid acyl-transferase [Pseudomonas sp. BN417]|uniref:C45 family autoproteolytic acyltransferase/hydolase n=1 Tax=Pseudomonas sp. BN417 TaxID=2567890 RepID=UPI0024573374|nr:C45 family autoproteolytic acyltransferase/hydolase [Pseudomonas sp. BN417]MDH4557070.1 acyl-CoA--6-aminopenicillanic acid acyl-transferase [Pseudomonas sp. BN417]